MMDRERETIPPGSGDVSKCCLIQKATLRHIILPEGMSSKAFKRQWRGEEINRAGLKLTHRYWYNRWGPYPWQGDIFRETFLKRAVGSSRLEMEDYL